MATGLNTDFIIDNGGFVLSSGGAKAYNDLWFLMNFDLLRTYLEDFNPGFETLLEKTGSYLLQNKTLILGNLIKLVSKYVPNITILNTDLLYGIADRKQYFVMVEHQYTPDGTVSTAVTFVGS